MSGIVGIVNFDGRPIDRAFLTNLSQSLSFRGPDGIQTWVKENVGFGHASLKTNDEDQILPLTLDGGTCLTAHARIDGQHELKNALSQNFPDVKHSSSDAQLILLSYQRWGDKCVEHLIGDFSFAIWDSRKRRLFCARDQMGVGQFYYAWINETFVFSNTLNCLRLHPVVSSRLNEVAIGDFLLFGLNQDRTSSIFADIHRLPRAHSLEATANGVSTREYWVPTTKAVRYQSASEYVERFRELLEAAVTDRLRSKQVSIAMSGGLDSSMIAAVASFKKNSQVSKLKAYCVVYGQTFPDDEKVFASEVATALGISIEYLEADLINQHTTPRTWGYAPEPFDVEPFYVVSDEQLRRMALRCRVALTGWDGDTFMTETPRHLFRELWRTHKFGELSRALSSYVYFQRSPPPVGVRTWLRRRAGQVEKPPYPTWLDEEFAKRLNLSERWKQRSESLDSPHATRPYAFRNINSPHWDSLFARFDAGVCGFPIEVRHPLVDLRLVEYLLGLPVIPWLLGKHILRESMRGVLPESIRTRKKTPLAGDPGMQLRHSPKAKEIDTFVPTSQFLDYIKREEVPSLRTETDSNNLWVNARPFSLNHWLINSYKVENESIVEHHDEGHREYSQAGTLRSAQTALHQAYSSELWRHT